jgi:hypothetical protein
MGYAGSDMVVHEMGSLTGREYATICLRCTDSRLCRWPQWRIVSDVRYLDKTI